MFIGHFAVAFAAKRVAPRPSLGFTFVAAQLADLLWPIFLLLGIEQVRIVPNGNPFLNLEFTNYPWSHSLVMQLVLGAVLGGLYALRTRDARGALVLFALVPSHWVLDWISHVPDMPLAPMSATKVGLGLWRSPTATIIVEVIMYVAGVAIYARSTKAIDNKGRYGFWALAVALVAFYALSIVSPPPPSVTALAIGALIGWPLALWPWWVDRHRRSTA
jgi:LexA-binding, inner membrane-associated putative hydrolase